MLLLTGFIIGILIGFTGSGGGSLLTPVLIMVHNISPTIAVGTDLLFSAITKISSGYMHWRKKTYDSKIAFYLIVSSVPASILVSILINLHLIFPFNDSLFHTIIGLMLIVTSIFITISTFFLNKHAVFHSDIFLKYRYSLTAILGIVLGILVTLSSIGAGTIGTCVLFLLHPLKLTPLKLVGTDIIFSVPLSIIAASGYIYYNNVNYQVLFNLLMGSIPGIICGTYLLKKVPVLISKSLIAIILLFVGIRMI